MQITLGCPPKKQVLFIDPTGIENVIKSTQLCEKDFLVVNPRDRTVSIPVAIVATYFFLKSIITIKHRNVHNISYYLAGLIRMCGAKIVITCMDYNIYFYELKGIYAIPRYVAVQIARRNNEKNEFFDELSRRKAGTIYQCDMIFAMTEAVAREYERHIRTRTTILGGLRSNMVPLSTSRRRDDSILFLSQYRSNRGYPYLRCEDEAFSHEDFHEAELRTLSAAIETAKILNKKIILLNPIPANFDEFVRYYSSHFESDILEFANPNTQLGGAYEYIDSFETILGIDSTLLYEAISRGNKVSVNDARLLGSKYTRNSNFFWPLDHLKNSFPFVARSYDAESIRELVRAIVQCERDDWNHNIEKIKPLIPPYFYNNAPLSTYVRSYLYGESELQP